MSDTIAPQVGDWLISPIGKRWQVEAISDYFGHTVYDLRRPSPPGKRGVMRGVYLREIAKWRRADA